MSVFDRVGMRTGFIWTTGSIARLAAANGDARTAARLAGAATALRDSMHVPLPPSVQHNMDLHLNAAREQIGEAAYLEARRTGSTLSLDEAAEAALAYLDGFDRRARARESTF
jgi:hypothetical protein